ncbi:MAG: hypothetical protein K6A69_07690 [Lachnospiraceae bacterium]|nr:hypothetical protein [Lachnospiraceae bacterium]
MREYRLDQNAGQVLYYNFTEGNAARSIALPDEEFDYIPRTREERERERWEKERKERRRLEKKKSAAMRKSRIYTFYLIVAAAVFSLFFVGYVQLQNDIDTSKDHITALQDQITELKAENQATENRIHSDANLQVIKDTAINEYGMVYATSSQIVYYDVEKNDFMSQYNDIP